MTTRTLLLSLAFLLAAACGGGGGAAPAGDPQPDPDPDPDPTPSELALSILEDCGPDALAGVGEYVALFQGIVTGTLPGVTVNNASPAPEQLDLAIDLDADMVPDTAASVRFENTPGEPADLGWTEMQLMDLLMTGISALPPLLAALDGTTVILDAALPGPPAVDGSLEVLYTSGAPDTADGSLSVNQSPCQTQVTFSGLDYAGLLTTFPTATLTASFAVSPDTLAGTIVMDGTVLAAATMALNGGSDMTFTINLTTGEVLALP